jgi:hypothetical protein
MSASVNSKGSKSSWNSRSNAYQEEVERLQRVLNDYESVNKDLQDEIQRMKEIEEVHKKRLQDYDKLHKQFQKKIKSLEVSLKYEKVASEGLRKRGNTFEANVQEYKEKATYSEQKRTYFSEQNVDLESTLQHERSTRLQLLHEKNKIFHELQEWKKKYGVIEKENLEKNQKIVLYIQQIETLTEKSQRQDDLLDLQADEFLVLSKDLTSTKENLLKTKEQLLQAVNEKSNFHFSIDLLQKEISFLRREIILSSENTTNKSYSAFHPNHKQQYMITNEVNAVTSKRYNDSKFRYDHSFSGNHSKQQLLLENNNRNELETSSFITPLNQSLRQQQLQLQQQSMSMSGEFPSLFDGSTVTEQLKSPNTATGGGLGHSQSLSHTQPQQSITTSSAPSTRGLVSRLSTADRPRGALDYLSTTNKESANFNNKERVEMLDWIRTSGNEIASHHPLSANHSKRKQGPSGEELNLKLSLENMQKAYSGGSVVSSKSGNNTSKMSSSPLKSQSVSQLDLGHSLSSQQQQKQGDERQEESYDEEDFIFDEELKRKRKEAAQTKKNKNNTDYSKKSLYVSSGLNYKHPEELDQQLKDLQSGSTKQILKKILQTID